MNSLGLAFRRTSYFLVCTGALSTLTFFGYGYHIVDTIPEPTTAQVEKYNYELKGLFIFSTILLVLGVLTTEVGERLLVQSLKLK